ncbi:MAG: photosynthetic reaction center cytochrome PufC [Pseudomonadota bacterium]
MNAQNKTGAVTVAGVLAALIVTAGCERPPVDSQQSGFRGTGMVVVTNPRLAQADDELPAALPAAPSDGPRAGDVYQNVQVLGDLSVAEFTRLMTAITQWVSPEEGCNYCHVADNLADESVYTKGVSRRMIQMTQHINADWSDHVGAAGVNCYTCHRGNNVPTDIWFESDAAANMAAYAGQREGQNIASERVGLASLPDDALTNYLTGDNLDAIRVNSASWAPTGATGSIQETEWTYGLMVHLSESLGVNCNFCHNSRQFAGWTESSQQRVTAWHGLRMVAGLNNDYLVPLGPAYPEERLGPLGDAPKAGCATCHKGQQKPLGGANAVEAYPSLIGR